MAGGAVSCRAVYHTGSSNLLFFCHSFFTFVFQVNQSSAGPTQRKSTRLVNPVTGRRIKAWWSKEEAEYLVELVMKYGKGKWKKILVAGKEDNYFDGRTPVDLKDKFRSLEKAASRIVGEG